MPLKYDDIPGSWGTQSVGWPQTSYTMGKWLLCTKAEIVPDGSYVVVGSKSLGGGNYDYSNAVIRCETIEQVRRLEAAYNGMFVECRHLLLAEEFANFTKLDDAFQRGRNEAFAEIANLAIEVPVLAQACFLIEATDALKPFKEAADNLDDTHPDTTPIWESSAAMSIDAEHLRKAAKVYNELTGGKS